MTDNLFDRTKRDTIRGMRERLNDAEHDEDPAPNYARYAWIREGMHDTCTRIYGYTY